MPIQDPSPGASTKNSGPASLLEALDRFYSSASFYPADHTQCQNSLTELYKAIDANVPSGESLILEPAPTGLCFQGSVLDQTHLGSENLLKLLDTLGIARLTINSKASFEDLHSMVSTLNTLKLEASSTLGFSSISFKGLPPSVKVVQRKFGWRQLNLGLDNTLTEKLLQQMNQLMDLIEQQPWNDARKEEFRLQTENLLVKSTQRTDSSLVRSAQGQRSQEDALTLGASVVKSAISSLSGDDDPRSINQVFNQAAELFASDQDAGNMELLFEILRESSDDVEKKSTPDLNFPQSDDTPYDQSIENLSAKVMQISSLASEPQIVSVDYSQEILSICLKMICGGLTDTHAQHLRKLLAKQLSPPIEQDKVETLEQAARRLVDAGDRAPVDQVFPLLIPHLLRNNGEALAQCLERVGPMDQPEKLAILWPHLVGLMLMPRPSRNRKMLNYLNEAITTLPAEMINEEAHRLDFLPAVQSGKMGTALLQWPLIESRPVLEALLAGKQGALMGQQLHRSWMDKAPNKLAGVLIRVLGPYVIKHQRHYRTILSFSSTGELGRDDRGELSKMIQNALTAMDDDARKAGWIVQAISELGQLGSPKCADFLEEIQNRKILGLKHAWTKENRTAARSAAQKISSGKMENQ